MPSLPSLLQRVPALAFVLLLCLTGACNRAADAPSADEPVTEVSQGGADEIASHEDDSGTGAGEEEPDASVGGSDQGATDTTSDSGTAVSATDAASANTDPDAPTPGPTPTRAPTADILATATAVAERRSNSGINVPLEDFVAELEKRVLGRDWTGLATLAADPIAVAPYAGEWSELSAGRLVSELGTFYLPEGADPAFSPPETDIAALLGGMDPAAMLGPDVKVARVIHSTGWGSRATDDVLLFISEAPAGGYRWEALLWSSGSFPGP